MKFETEDFNQNMFLAFPIAISEEIEGLENLKKSIDLSLVLVNVLEQRTILVTNNPELNQNFIENDSNYSKFARFYLMICNDILLDSNEATNLNNKLSEDSSFMDKFINAPTLVESILEFYESLQGDYYLEYLCNLNFAFYEPDANNMDVDSITSNLATADFAFSNAHRIVANTKCLEMMMQIPQEEFQMFAEQIYQMTQQFNASPEFHIGTKQSEEPLENHEIIQDLQGELHQIVDICKEKANVFYAFELTNDQMKRCIIYMIIVDKNCSLMY